MARQRNNVARLPWEARKVVCEKLFDNATNAEINRALAETCKQLGIPSTKAHGSTLTAYATSAEYKTYCNKRREWDERMGPKRWAAALQNDGAGPQTVADLAEMAVLEQLHALAVSGAALESGDIVKVARAITTMQRTQIARRGEETDARITGIEDEHAAEIAELAATIAAKDSEIEQLRERLEEKTGSGDVDLSKVADEMDRILG